MYAAPSLSRSYELFVGIDVSAATFTVSWMAPTGRPSWPITIEQTAQGYTFLQHQLCANGISPQAILLVLEATGSYWITLATTLAEAGFAVCVINPAQVHDFAKALLKRAKTDDLDAQMLAELAVRLQPEPWTPPPAVYAELQQRLMQRESLVQIRTQVRNQRHALLRQPRVIAAVHQRMDDLIDTLDQQIADSERELAVALRQDDAWAAAAERLPTISGIGMLTACWILITTLKFTLCPTPEAAASHAGLAPYVSCLEVVSGVVLRLARLVIAIFGGHSIWQPSARFDITRSSRHFTIGCGQQVSRRRWHAAQLPASWCISLGRW